MDSVLNEKVVKFLEEKKDETIELIETICKIPAPSGKEERRAEFVKNWLTSIGAKGVYIDKALNVVYPLNCDGRDDIVAFMAHTDTVFPDLTEMPFRKDDKCLYSPGVGDDTTCLAIMLMVIRYVVENNIKSNRGILFVADSCEEGLGNLKGVKNIFEEYDGRIKEFYTFDGGYKHLVNKCVGSHRYELCFKTAGGHSFGAFGNRNAVHAMSQLICELYKCEVPVEKDSKTTYNVGIVEGGTSVNTIAQNAKMLYEYRSDNYKCLKIMEEFFNEKVEKARQDKSVEIEVKVLGVRPCGGDVDVVKLSEMEEKVRAICEKHTGIPCKSSSGSTDCNIPMSKCVPSICVGTYNGGGAHTREEFVEIDSIPIGLKITAELVLSYFEK